MKLSEYQPAGPGRTNGGAGGVRRRDDGAPAFRSLHPLPGHGMIRAPREGKAMPTFKGYDQSQAVFHYIRSWIRWRRIIRLG